jgi:hypothetical protein
MNLYTSKYGFHILSNNLFEINEETQKEFESIYHSKKHKSNEYQNTSIINNLDDIEVYPEINRIFKKIDEILKDNNYHEKIKFDDIWFIRSTKQTIKPGELPYIPHIDKVRKFKVMIYLNDVEKDDGPINFIKVDPEKFENFRKKLKKDYKLRKENVIENFPLNNYDPLVGKNGTAIFFDTNAPHFAGEIKKDFTMRKVIRFNYRFFERSKKIELILNKISQLLSN